MRPYRPLRGRIPASGARCRAEQVPSRGMRWMRPRRRAWAGTTRLGRLHCRIPTGGAPAPSCAGPCSALRGRTPLNWPRPRTSAISSKSESLACVLIARSAVRPLPARACLGGAAVSRPGQANSDAALCAPSRTTLRETESGAHPRKRARCGAEQVPSRGMRWMRPRRRAWAGTTRLGRLHCRIPTGGAPAPSCAGPCSALRGRTPLNGPRPRTSAISSKSESLACAHIARSAVASPRAGPLLRASRSDASEPIQTKGYHHLLVR